MWPAISGRGRPFTGCLCLVQIDYAGIDVDERARKQLRAYLMGFRACPMGFRTKFPSRRPPVRICFSTTAFGLVYLFSNTTLYIILFRRTIRTESTRRRRAVTNSRTNFPGETPRSGSGNRPKHALWNSVEFQTKCNVNNVFSAFVSTDPTSVAGTSESAFKKSSRSPQPAGKDIRYSRM